MRKIILPVIATALMASTANGTYSYPTTLEGCEAFAAKFDNTCDTSAGALDDFTAHTGEAVSCPVSTISSEDYCAGTVTDGVCTWYRKLCVTCYTKTVKGTTTPYIRV
jgi:hypothetical protein